MLKAQFTGEYELEVWIGMASIQSIICKQIKELALISCSANMCLSRAELNNPNAPVLDLNETQF